MTALLAHSYSCPPCPGRTSPCTPFLATSWDLVLFLCAGGLTFIFTVLSSSKTIRTTTRCLESNSRIVSYQWRFVVMVHVFVGQQVMSPRASCSTIIARVSEPFRPLSALCSPCRRRRMHPPGVKIVGTSAPSTLTAALAPRPLSPCASWPTPDP